MPFPTFKPWICSSFFVCRAWLWWHVWFVNLLGVCTYVCINTRSDSPDSALWGGKVRIASSRLISWPPQLWQFWSQSDDSLWLSKYVSLTGSADFGTCWSSIFLFLSVCLPFFSLPPLLLYTPQPPPPLSPHHHHPSLGISVWVNTSRMWTKKHTRAGINSPRGCVCVALCVVLELSHIVVVRVCVGVCSVGSVAHRRACAWTHVYVSMWGDNEQRRDVSAQEWRQQWLSHVGDRAGPASQICRERKGGTWMTACLVVVVFQRVSIKIVLCYSRACWEVLKKHTSEKALFVYASVDSIFKKSCCFVHD